MFRLWAKLWKDSRMVCDTVICDDSDKRRTQKVLAALEKAAYEFNLERPIWLDKTVHEFQRFNSTRFYQDNFIESIDFDFLEIQVIEEDEFY